MFLRSDQYVNLHLHSEYSLLDGACRIDSLIDRVKELGQTACAVTDHGNMYAAAEFWKKATAAGIKPVIGCEVYVAPRTRFDKEPSLDSKPYHLILLCENQQGYSNLVKLVSAANLEGFYSKPRVDREILAQYHEGLICLSGCVAGEVARNLLAGNYSGAKQTALDYRDIFGEGNYFLEVQNHSISEETAIIPQIYRLSAETGIPLAATNDCHYVRKEDAETQNVLMCISTGKILGQPDALSFGTEEFYMKSADEMAMLFPGHEEAVTNTAEIAERCNVTLNFDGNIKLPEFPVPEGIDHMDYLRQLCYSGLSERYGTPTKALTDRLEHELEVIISMNFTDYFLIVWDFIRFAKEQGIPVGPGRGSGAGSLCAYCMHITDIDPIRFDLMFERFLNPERKSMPDFDVDFCIEGRKYVKEYVVRKYGSDRVCEIIAFDTLKAKAAVRDVARVLDMPYSVADLVAKLIDQRFSLAHALENSPELKALYRSDRSVRRLVDIAAKIEGMPRHTSVHAAGVVISAVPLSDLVPLQKNDDTIVTQYTKKYLEALGLLKMDFLGLRNLTIIRDAVREIVKIQPDFDLNRIPMDDKGVYEMLSKGETAGVFQLESPGMTQRLMEMRPERLEDLIVILSLYRPGPMQSIPEYIRNKHDPSVIPHIHPQLDEILADTYGVMVYQEQVMEIFRRLAGYSYGHADIVRRAMCEKNPTVMEQEKSSFISGARERGVREEDAENIFARIQAFASYAFNKSHAAAYACVSYQTAYLKYHFRGIYMAALMSSVMGNTSKLSEYIDDCRSAGTQVLCPHINRSMRGFTYTDGKMYFGLSAVKNTGIGLADRIIAERTENGEFRSLQDFCERVSGRDMNKKALENLIKAGALDGLGLNRRQMLGSYEMIMDAVSSGSRGVIEGQMNLFGEDTADCGIKVPYEPEYPMKRILAMEKEAAGMYLSGSPLSEHQFLADLMHVTRAGSIVPESGIRDGDKLKLMVIVQGRKEHITKNGDKMAFVTFSDNSGEVEGVVFPDLFASSGALFTEGNILWVSGHASVKDESISVICENIISERNFDRMTSGMRLCIKSASSELPDLSVFSDICRKFPGETTVCVYLTDQRKMIRPKTEYRFRITPESAKIITNTFSAEKTGLIG